MYITRMDTRMDFNQRAERNEPGSTEHKQYHRNAEYVQSSRFQHIRLPVDATLHTMVRQQQSSRKGEDWSWHTVHISGDQTRISGTRHRQRLASSRRLR